MADEIPQYYWDTCVFIAYLNEDRDAYGDLVDDIGQFLLDAKEKKAVIHCSTITIAEITKGNIKGTRNSSFLEFLNEFSAAVVPISPDPNVMALASELRSLTYTKTGGTRKLYTPDAIHLASALTLIDTYGVPLTAFHTFDNGKSRGAEGPGTPLLTFETWCESCAIALNRSHPVHPDKRFL